MVIWNIFEIILFTYFLYVVFYNTFFSIGGLFYKTPLFISKKAIKENRIAVFIPAYKEDNVIIEVATQALSQSYPKFLYDVIVIADSLKKETISKLRKLNIYIHEVHFQNSTKVKSLKSAFNIYKEYDIAVILDADNVMNFDFLELINKCFNQDWRVVQGRRTAKNLNTSFAILDGLSEVINNHISRQGPEVIGLSSSLIGSGLAFNYSLLNESLFNITAIGGFDKVLQANILQKKVHIHYLKCAVVFDEKVDSSEVFKNQRKRWISSQYKYLKEFFWLGLRALFRGNISLFNMTFLAQVQFPRIINIGLLFIISLIFSLFPSVLFISILYWWLLFVIFLLSIIIIIPFSYYNKHLLKALTKIPIAFLLLVEQHFKLKDSDKEFIHTPHKHK